MANKVKIVRGTTNTFSITVTNSEGRAVSLATGEKIIFGVKKNPTDVEVLFAKVATTAGIVGQFNVKLEPADTADLDTGRYYYDVGMQSGTDYFNIIDPSPFDIEANITEWGCAN